MTSESRLSLPPWCGPRLGCSGAHRPGTSQFFPRLFSGLIASIPKWSNQQQSRGPIQGSSGTNRGGRKGECGSESTGWRPTRCVQRSASGLFGNGWQVPGEGSISRGTGIAADLRRGAMSPAEHQPQIRRFPSAVFNERFLVSSLGACQRKPSHPVGAVSMADTLQLVRPGIILAEVSTELFEMVTETEGAHGAVGFPRGAWACMQMAPCYRGNEHDEVALWFAYLTGGWRLAHSILTTTNGPDNLLALNCLGIVVEGN
ncbi:hypothetical protein QBC38DRAFT_48959 [Podospora fimiseda]|uniref:Uncharacterized protein n=1 Tax=Podospora fimiseda TaxID=252190 RepID=A0AAN7BV62_9PEZI|nr:hypothetical protein QBC38DRAFT_48959 [Podospora fimiseda]